MATYLKAARDKIEKTMHEYKNGELKLGKGGKGGIVKSRKQEPIQVKKKLHTGGQPEKLLL